MNLRNNRRGQAAVEFMTVVVVIFFFLLFYLSFAMVLVVSQYMDYATFMAARTYKSGFSTETAQQNYAREVFNQYASAVDGIARNYSVTFQSAQPGDEQTKGIAVDYEMDLFYLPPVFVRGAGPSSRLRLRSESYLGRDPAYEDCKNYFKNYANSLGPLGAGLLNLIGDMEDNGC